MKLGKFFHISVISILGIFLFSVAWASGSGSAIVLQPLPKQPHAYGTAVIGKDHISIQARGLKAEAVYTVWFVNMKPKKSEAGAGAAPFMFRTDKWGNGNYSAPLAESPYGKWAMLMVVLHPDGNPENMSNMVGALKAPL